MKLLRQLVKNVPPLIKRKKLYYREVHTMIFRVFHFSIIVQEFKKRFVALYISSIVYLSKISYEYVKVHQGKMKTHTIERK